MFKPVFKPVSQTRYKTFVARPAKGSADDGSEPFAGPATAMVIPL